KRVWVVRQRSCIYGGSEGGAAEIGAGRTGHAALHGRRSGTGSKWLVGGTAGGDQFWYRRREAGLCDAEEAPAPRTIHVRRVLGGLVRSLGRAPPHHCGCSECG